jgi:hypothetical protein
MSAAVSLDQGSPRQIHRSFLLWRDGLYGKLALALSLLCVALYWLHHPSGPPNGGTWLGYGLGVVGFALIGWLSWFGIRRRRYGNTGPLEEWLSAHVYFGLALIVVATLHTGFRFHWNVHTLAFALMALVIFSGMFGTYAFWRYPGLMTENRSGATLGAMVAELARLDASCLELAQNFPDDIVTKVRAAIEGIGGRFSVAEALLGRRPDPLAGPTGTAVAALQDVVGGREGLSPSEVLPLVQAMTARAALVQRLRRDWRFRALMVLWRAIHVPLTIALLIALVIHVFAVFYYW